MNPLYFEWDKFIPTLERQLPDILNNMSKQPVIQRGGRLPHTSIKKMQVSGMDFEQGQNETEE